MKYFDAVVQVRIDIGKGRYKRVKKNYLVDSLTVTEAEARVVKVFEEMGGIQEYNVLGVNGSKVMDAIVINGDTHEGVQFYEVSVEVRIESTSEDDTIRVKKVKENFLIEAYSVSDAETKAKKIYDTAGGFSNDFEIISVRRSKVVEIITPETKELKELPEGKWLTKDTATATTEENDEIDD